MRDIVKKVTQIQYQPCNVVFTSGAGDCHYQNQWRQSWHYEDSGFATRHTLVHVKKELTVQLIMPGYRHTHILVPRVKYPPYHALTGVWEERVNTLRPRQNGRHFADETFIRIFMNENVRISINISLRFVPKGLINNIPALVEIMAWRRPGDKPLSEPMIVNILTHICVTRPQWVNSPSSSCSVITSQSGYGLSQWPMILKAWLTNALSGKIQYKQHKKYVKKASKHSVRQLHHMDHHFSVHHITKIMKRF